MVATQSAEYSEGNSRGDKATRADEKEKEKRNKE